MEHRIDIDRIMKFALIADDIAGTKRSYNSMKQRCLDKDFKHYHNYGGRGITICQRWLGGSGFNNFVEDVGYRQNRKLSIDRINNEGNYEPGNCKWSTRSQQQLNRRNTIIKPT